MKIRKIKKLLKSYKYHLEMILKEESEEEGNRVVFFPKEELQFTKFGVSKCWKGNPYEHIPYWRMGRYQSINLNPESKIWH